ncbi:MAG: hypothetical protein EU551_02700 [Promethearchaeota archaeon]|nr:MAG: hypothetical protein EU551_02700 [Candidatus Lokiarchaeota archaeon]
MTDDSSRIKKISYTRNELFEIRREKLRLELAAARRLLKSNVEPLLIADKFIHDAYVLLKDGLRRRYPDLDEEAINQKIRNQSELYYKLKQKKNRENING